MAYIASYPCEFDIKALTYFSKLINLDIDGSKVMEGPETEEEDDAKSIAKCPDGYAVSSCIVGTG